MVNNMTNPKTYNIFLFLSTFTRGLVEVFSLVLLYKQGFKFNNLVYFLFIMYTVGILVNYLSLKFYYKTILILSSLLYGISFIYLSNMPNNLSALTIFAILLAGTNYSYHVLKHYLALTMVPLKKRNSNKLVTLTYLGTISASLLGMYLINELSLTIISIIIFVLSFIAIFPILKQSKLIIPTKTSNTKVNISKDKVFFSILEQFKVIFLELQPIFLYIYVDNSIYYVGVFNVITNLASLIVVYYLAKKITKTHFKYYTLILGLIFILKLNIKSGSILLLIALLEGIFVKIYETISLDNLYDYNKNNIKKYLFLEELIFFTTKSIVMLLFLIFKLNIYSIMYINIIGIIISGFFIKETIPNKK